MSDEDDDLDEYERVTRTNMRVAAPGAHFGPLPEIVRAELEVTAGPDLGARFNITSVPCFIGRGRHATVQLTDSSVSRLHAVIAYEDDEFRIIDNQSENGTCLNGSKVTAYRLVDGDSLTIAGTTLRFSVR
jgi:pSer/pThr/pTyr-binding forkhead associated (FHA) protein